MISKKQTVLLATVLFAVFTLTFAATTAWILIEQNIPYLAWFTGTFFILFLGVTAFGVRQYRRPDDWFREAERREALWIQKHPYLAVLSVIISISVPLWKVIGGLIHFCSEH